MSRYAVFSDAEIAGIRAHESAVVSGAKRRVAIRKVAGFCRALVAVSKTNKIEFRALKLRYRQALYDRHYLLERGTELRDQVLSLSARAELLGDLPGRCIFCGERIGNFRALTNPHTAALQRQLLREHLAECSEAPWNE